MIEIKTRHIIIGVLIALFVAFGAGWLLGRLARNETSNSIINGLNQTMRIYEYRIGGMLRQAREKDALIMSQRQALKEGLILKEELRLLKIKHLNEVTHLETSVDILLDSIAYIQANPPVNPPCPPDENHPVLYLPLAFHETNEYLNLQGLFDENGKLSMDIKLPLSMDVWTGFDKKTKKYKAVLTYENPYVQTIDIRNVKMEWSKVSRFGIGVIGGYGVSWGNLKPQPIIGIGIAYNVIRF